MKNRILRLKNIACAAVIVLMMAGNASAALVYSTDFTTSYTTSNAALDLGGATPDVVAGDWFGSSQTPGVAGDVLTLGILGDNRFRGSGVWLDTTGWATGLVTVEVDVTSYTAGTDGATTFFQAYAATGVDATNLVSLDLHSGPDVDPTGSTGTATISALGSDQLITGAGTDVPFTFNFNGTDQFVGLVFANNNPNVTPNANTGATVVLDNLTVDVTAVPEPSSVALFLGGIGVLAMRRRRHLKAAA
ncbi:PEP-CTERM protein-sorting domain-containing protein [Neorhodopirellula lusitana]|uniref:PEP-CTERM protein-sorting domain-containing protein n=1 Tax=Neorhodopirellula lusitana TaxID=445327 RepID=A0ABY1PRL5_9BACT|nr:PEP-CTERM sorting domain-containing protein [Neorhodopirellula lusitana]SMP43610.1 PEP-CTERM protein-sorting domain-containing protein [Neorhodopirellula lusitana]